VDYSKSSDKLTKLFSDVLGFVAGDDLSSFSALFVAFPAAAHLTLQTLLSGWPWWNTYCDSVIANTGLLGCTLENGHVCVVMQTIFVNTLASSIGRTEAFVDRYKFSRTDRFLVLFVSCFSQH